MVTFVTCAVALLVGLAVLYALHCRQAARFTPLADLRQLCASWRRCLCWGSAAAHSKPAQATAGKNDAAPQGQEEGAFEKEDGADYEAIETAMTTLMSGLGLGEEACACAALFCSVP